MLATLVWMWPNRRRYFLSDRWGGYAQSQPAIDRLHHPLVYPLVLALWAASAVALAANVMVVPAAMVNVLFCRYYFVQMEWRGLLRGMGAPGYMSYWLGVVVLLLEYTARYGVDLRGVALLVAQIDFALIMA